MFPSSNQSVGTGYACDSMDGQSLADVVVTSVQLRQWLSETNKPIKSTLARSCVDVVGKIAIVLDPQRMTLDHRVDVASSLIDNFVLFQFYFTSKRPIKHCVSAVRRPQRHVRCRDPSPDYRQRAATRRRRGWSAVRQCPGAACSPRRCLIGHRPGDARGLTEQNRKWRHSTATRWRDGSVVRSCNRGKSWRSGWRTPAGCSPPSLPAVCVTAVTVYKKRKFRNLHVNACAHTPLSRVYLMYNLCNKRTTSAWTVWRYCSNPTVQQVLGYNKSTTNRTHGVWVYKQIN